MTDAQIPPTISTSWRQWLYETIFETDTFAGRWFDILLIVSIIISVIVVMLDSVNSIHADWKRLLYVLEWGFTLLFTIEYVLRLISIGRPVKYATSFWGIIDLLAIIPTYVSLVIPHSKFLLVIRIIRLLRIFRVLKLLRYMGEANQLLAAMRASRHRIVVFLFAVLALVIIFGSILYIVEGEKNGFTSIPRSIYWAIVTLTTVGYGDISPKTDLGQILAAFVMILGYSILAVPTGIVTVEMTHAMRDKATGQACPDCSAQGHDRDAVYCKYCGASL